MEDEGVLPLDVLDEVGDLVGEGAAGVVEGPGDVAVVAPLLVPDVDDGDVGTPPQREKLGAGDEGDATRQAPYSLFWVSLSLCNATMLNCAAVSPEMIAISVSMAPEDAMGSLLAAQEERTNMAVAVNSTSDRLRRRFSIAGMAPPFTI